MLPLDDIKVIEVGQLIAGPYCGQLLADFGADVVKIEPPGKGDAMRQWGRPDENGRTMWWLIIARNKKSVTLDLREEKGQALLKRMVAEADVLVENFRPGTMERWGLGWETLEEINPRLIMVRVTGFGQTGPYAARAGYASVCEAMGGLRHICGYPDRPPVRVGISIGDTLAGMNAAMGTLLALQHRHRSGKGQVVDSSIFEAVLGVMESLIPDYVNGNYIRERAGSVLPGLAPSNAYPAKDGRDIIIGANQDSVFRRLCGAMGQPRLADDPRFGDHQARGRHQAELDEVIAAWTRCHDVERLVELLAEQGVPAGLVYRAPDMMRDPHFQARRAIIDVPDPEYGTIPMQNTFPRLSATPGRVQHTGPALGQDTDRVLQEWLGCDQEMLEALRRTKII